MMNCCTATTPLKRGAAINACNKSGTNGMLAAIARLRPRQRLVVEAVRCDKTLVELPDMHANKVNEWKKLLFELAAGAFGAESASSPTVDVKAFITLS